MRAVPDGEQPVERAMQEVDYGRRGKGYIFGAFQPASGEAFTRDYARRTIANWVDFLGLAEDWIPPEIAHVYAILDNLNVHRATDVLFFSLAHPRWEFVFQPKVAAYLNLIEARPSSHRDAAWRETTTRSYHHRAPGPSARRPNAAGGASVSGTERTALGDRAAGRQPPVCPRVLVRAPRVAVDARRGRGTARGKPRVGPIRLRRIAAQSRRAA